jgi:S-adenosylmethionine:tRNA ribosyltransferase-isomerase
MKLEDFDYELPEELIAQTPADKREFSKMMHLNNSEKTIDHNHFYDIVDLLDENHILI